uniref:tail fiber assembly protein n=1 Tax=Enterobacter quasiroggenkampii TaxID=2497436 RepID=UPI00398C2C9F
MMKFNSIYNPVWADSAHSAINVTIDTDEYGAMPFTAKSNDTEDYGVMIYQECIAGVFGNIAEYVAPIVDNVAANDAEKARLMAVATSAIAPLNDAVDLGIATEDEIAALTAWKTYRVTLNRIDTHAEEIEWPAAPAS